MLPDGWSRQLFKQVLKLDRGSSPRPIVNFITEDDDGVNWIKIGDTKGKDAFIDSTKEKITLEGAKKSRKVSKGEIVLSNSMSYGKPYILNIDGYIHDGWFVIRQYQSSLDKWFLIQVLGSELVQRQYKRLAAGGVVTNISSELVYAVKINFPPLPEQRKIAKILSTWDKAISTTERLIDNSKQQKKALMQQLLTGKKRLLDDSGRPFEGEWEQIKLSSLAFAGKSNFTDGDWIESPYISESGCRLIQTGNIGVGVFRGKSQKYISETSFHELKCTEVKVGDLLICRLAEPAGRACVVPDLGESKMLTSVDVTIMKVDTNKSTAEFLCHYFSLEHTLYTVSTLCGGSTRSRVSRTNLGGMKINLPEVNEQNKIAKVLSIADKEIDCLEQQLANLKQEKKALMQQLLTGKRRVKTDDEAVV